MGTRQHVDAERPVHQGRPAPSARTGGLHPGAVQTCGQRSYRGRGFERHAPVHDHSRALERASGARGQHPMARECSVNVSGACVRACWCRGGGAFRPGSRSRSPATCSPAGGCGPSQQSKFNHFRHQAARARPSNSSSKALASWSNPVGDSNPCYPACSRGNS